VVSRFVRKVRTSSGAVAVRIVTRRGRRVERIEHVGSAHSDGELALLLALVGERLAPGQGLLDRGEVPARAARLEEVADWTRRSRAPAGQQALDEALDAAAAPGPPRRGRRPAAGAGGQVVATSSLVLWQALTGAYRRLGFDTLADEAFRAMVLARIIEPTSRTDSLRVLAEIGAPCPSVRTLYRSLKRCQEGDYRDKLAKASEEDTGAKALRKVGMSKLRRGRGHAPYGCCDGSGWRDLNPRPLRPEACRAGCSRWPLVG
jgi:hypothetical protein